MNQQEYEEIVKQRPEMKAVLEKVKASYRQSVYWRRKRDYPREKWSAARKHAVLRFSEAAHKSFGKKGFDEKGVPIVASNAKKAIEGRRFKGKSLLDIRLEDMKLALREAISAATE